MRLLDTETGQFVDKDPEDEETVYAILSHTWDGDGEQTYEQLKKIQQRYSAGSQTPQSQLPFAETHGAAFPRLVGGLPTALKWLTESEVEALLRLVAETFGLAIPAPVPSPCNYSVPSLGPHLSKPPPQSIWEDPELSPKIRDACRVARENGYRYIWIDSCCIDKSSSSELSEAINSMYRWYGLAAVCYAYLADVPPGEDHYSKRSAFRRSRWFRRGWTLQELLGPLKVEFLSEDWAPIGSKYALVDLVESVTKIDYRALLHLKPLDDFSVAQRLSWAATRKTTREEDRAYSLMGIFDINMPPLYGEGAHAFRRLQEQILQRIPDQSLFAWEDVYGIPQLSPNPEDDDAPGTFGIEAQQYQDRERSLFAISPDYFQSCASIIIPHPDTLQLLYSHQDEIEYTFTPHGIRTQFPMIPITRRLLLRAMPQIQDIQLEFVSHEADRWYLAILGCEHAEYPGHLLGRVCYVPPGSSKSSIGIIYTGLLRVYSPQDDSLCRPPDLLPLSSHIIGLFRRRIKLKTIYIPHPDRSTPPASSGLRFQPYAAIHLVLLRETRNILVSRGYSADLRHQNPVFPSTPCLTLSNHEHTIIVELQCILENAGQRLTIEARIKMSRSSAGLDSSVDSDQVACQTVSWSDSRPWYTKLAHKRVELRVASPKTLSVDLGVEFAGGGHYFLRVDVISEELRAAPGSGMELAGEQAGSESERRDADKSLSEAIKIEEACREGSGGCEMKNVEAQDVVYESEKRAGELDSRGV